MNYSPRHFLGCLCLAIFFAGCSSQQIKPQEQHARALMNATLFVDHYGQVSGSFVEEYLSYLEQRLARALHKDPSSYSFILLDTFQPLGFSVGSGVILVSRGMVLSLQNEAELVFVLAHELAHQELGHTDLLLEELDSRENPNALHIDQSMELDADRFALGILAVAGYDPRFAVQSLVNSYRAADIDINAASHPQLEERLSSINGAIAQSKWQPPGTIDRRDYRALRRMLGSPSTNVSL